MENERISDWYGCRRLDFEFEGRPAIFVEPDADRAPDGPAADGAAGRPWVWRAEFFGAFDTADRALLHRGWPLLYLCVSDMYGCPEAVAAMKRFHDAAVKRFGLAEKAVLFGFSRGGLYAVNYAAAHPQDTAALYLDAPVLDITKWPGSLGKTAATRTPERDAEWVRCKRIYHLESDAEALRFRGSPLDRAGILLENRIPLMLVAGDSDTEVDFGENGEKLAELYRRAGVDLEVIVKKGVGHHPHSLKDPAPIVDFLLKETAR